MILDDLTRDIKALRRVASALDAISDEGLAQAARLVDEERAKRAPLAKSDA